MFTKSSRRKRLSLGKRSIGSSTFEQSWEKHGIAIYHVSHREGYILYVVDRSMINRLHLFSTLSSSYEYIPRNKEIMK